MKEEEAIKRRFKLVAGELNERSRRLVAASEAMALGWGGISAVSRATGLSRKAISHGVKELQEAGGAREGQIRRRGGGRKKTVSKDPRLVEDLERLVEPLTRGDPESPLRWTCKSLRKLAEELAHQGHQVSHQLVSEVLHDLGYSLQANRKTHEGGDHPDRDAQFEPINAQAEAFLAAGEPAGPAGSKKKGGGWRGATTQRVRKLAEGKGKRKEVERRVWAWVSQNWGGKPLVSYAVILKLIAATTTEAGLTVQCQLDTNSYLAGRKVSDEEMATLSILPDPFHGEWNYTIQPRTTQIDTIILLRILITCSNLANSESIMFSKGFP